MDGMFENHTPKQRLVHLAGLCIFSLLVWVVPFLQNGTLQLAGLSYGDSQYLTVTFLDIGQGDSTLIETPDGVQMLIDGGPDATVLRELSATLPWFDRTIDVVLGTHPDKDHIAGLVDVLERYRVGHIITTENTGDTTTAESYHDALMQEGATITMAHAGQVYQLGASTTVAVFSPANNPALLETNTASIVTQVRYGDITFMLTGDAPQSIENYLVTAYGDQLESEVLKLGHHGSKTSSSDEFLAAVRPQYAVVSSGKDNSYGHPAKETVARVTAAGIPIVNTAEGGRITFQTDGVTVWRVE